MSDNIKVVIKVRPLIKREKDAKLTSVWKINKNSIGAIENSYTNSTEQFTFDHIFDENASTEQLFENVIKPMVSSSVRGINGTIFAYGQTSSGKTHTMMGTEDMPGVIPLTVREIFHQIDNIADRSFLIRCGYIEIYNEKIFDLLNNNNINMKIHETITGDVSVNCKELITNSEEQILKILKDGNKSRRVGETNMNEHSSRSHTIFRIVIESRNSDPATGANGESYKTSCINLVDLAGSEKANATGATGARLKEGSHINKSLLSLSLVIQKLSETDSDATKFINYRDSKLTRILQASLGGNAITTIICNITPASFEESYYALSFANRAKSIKNKPTVNNIVSDAALMKELESEIKRLRSQLKEECRNREMVRSQLVQKIHEREIQFIHSTVPSTDDKHRRKTWCPTTNIPAKRSKSNSPDRSSVNLEDFTSPCNALKNGDGRITKTRSLLPPPVFKISETNKSDEIFISSSQWLLSPFVSPGSHKLEKNIHTPECFKRRSSISTNSDKSPNEKCRCLEQELLELQEFTNLEKWSEKKQHREEIESLMSNLADVQQQLESKISRCTELEQTETKCAELIEAHKSMEKIVDKFKKDCELAESIRNSIEYEFELYKKNSKKREADLLVSLDEARDEKVLKDRIISLETKLKCLEEENFNLFGNLDSEKLKYVNLEKVNIETTEMFHTKITELEKQLQNYINADTKLNEQQKLNAVIVGEKNKIQNESDELSTQLMDALEENDNLKGEIKKLQDMMQSNESVLKNNLHQLREEQLNLSVNLPDLDELEKRAAVIEKELDEIKMEKIEMEIKIVRLTEENHNYAKIVPELQENNAKLTENMELIEKEKVTILKRMQSIEIEIEDSCNMRGEYLNEIQILKENLCDLNENCKQMDQIKIENSLYEERITKINNDLNKLLAENENFQTMINEQNNANQSLSEEIQMKISEISRLQNQIENSSSDISEKETEIKEMGGRLLSQQNVIAELEKNNSQLIIELDIMRNKMNDIMTATGPTTERVNNHTQTEYIGENPKIDELSQHLKQLECEKISIHEAHQSDLEIISNLTIELNELKSKIIEIENVKESIANSLEKDKLIFEEQLDVYKLNNGQLKIEIETNVNKMVDLNKKLELIHQQLEEYKVMVSTKDETIQENSNKLLEQQQIIEQFEKNNIELIERRIQSEKLSRDIESINKENLILQNESKSLKLQCDDLNIVISKNNENLKEERDKVVFLENEKIELCMKQETLSAMVLDLENQQKSLKHTLDCDKMSVEDNMKVHKLQIHQLTEDIGMKKNENTQLNKDLDMIKQQLQVSDAEARNKENNIRDKEQEIENIKIIIKKLEETEKTLNFEVNDLKCKLLEKDNSDGMLTQTLQNKIMNLEIELNARDLRIENLTQQLSEVESERDILNEKYQNDLRTFQNEMNIFREEHNRQDEKFSRYEDEIKIVNTLKLEMKENAECRTELLQQNESLSKEVSQQQIVIDQIRSEMEKFQQEMKGNKNMNLELQQLQEERDEVNAKLEQLENVHIFKVSDMQRQIELKDGELRELTLKYKQMENEQKQLETVMCSHVNINEELNLKLSQYEKEKQETIKKTRKLAYVNDELKNKNQNLVLEINDMKRLTEKDRKSRRQSSHDERRDTFSIWDTNSVETMTDPTDINCNCQSMNEQIIELKRTIKIRDCQIGGMKMVAQVNPLRTVVDDLKKCLKKEERIQDNLRADYKLLSDQLTEKENVIKLMKPKVSTNEIGIQTDSEKKLISLNSNDVGICMQMKVEELNYEVLRLQKKYDDAKKLCRIRNETISALRAVNQEKENECNNKNSTTIVDHKNIESEISTLKKQNTELMEKYLNLKKIYYCKNPKSSNPQPIVTISESIQTDLKWDEHLVVKAKYEKAKFLYNSTRMELEELQNDKAELLQKYNDLRESNCNDTQTSTTSQSIQTDFDWKEHLLVKAKYEKAKFLYNSTQAELKQLKEEFELLKNSHSS